METDEVLESGYGPDTPPGDNALNDFVQGEADAWKTLAIARGDRVAEDKELGLMLADGGSPSPFGNVALLRRPIRDDEWPTVSERMQQFFGGHPGGPFLVFSGWPTRDLRSLGFGQIGHPPMMRRPPRPLAVPPVEGFEIRRVDDDDTAHDWERVLIEAYPVPELQPYSPGCFLSGNAVSAPGWHYFVGYLDGEAVATAGSFVDERHVRIEFISTQDACRGRGIGNAITCAATAADLTKPAMLIASDLGYPTYLRMGYEPLVRFTLWAGHRSG